jgi:2,3-bisphosphoglycerate-dependent phosphoglycerate mutase
MRPPKTEIILIRHGETLWNRERRMQGHTDTPLSEAGRAQAAALGARLAGGAFAVIYSSDLARAWDTAGAIAQRTGHEIVAEPRLRERRFGIFEGLTYDEMKERHPEEWGRFQTRDPDYAIPGGESARDFHARSLACLTEIAERHPGAELAVVTHGLVLDALYRAAHAMALDAPRPVPLLNASLNGFLYEGRGWRMRFWGDVAHLETAAVTRFENSSA